MLTSIGKLSKSFILKIFVGIIILPFVFWGMGDVFRGGNQNVIASVDSEKISTKEFVDYLRRLNLNEKQIKDLPKTDLVEKILSEYIGKKVMALEIKELGILINDNSLRKIIKNDKSFFKDEKFSRTEYEKFLLKSQVSAPMFEANIVEQEKRRQFLSSLSGGIVIPEILVKKEYRKENQIKTIQYIDLEQYHSKNKPTEKSKRELYDRNKNIFFTEFKSISFAEITPEKISGKKDYDETFFNQLDIIENSILDGQSFNEAAQNSNLTVVSIKKVNSNKEDQSKNKVNIQDDLFEKIYNLKRIKSPEVINLNDKYYLVEVSSIDKKNKPFEDTEVQQALNAQLNFKKKIENNTSTLTKSFLVLVITTDYKDLNKNSNEYEQYEAKARLNLINKIYQSHDNNLNEKYKVEFNQRTIERVKNSF